MRRGHRLHLADEHVVLPGGVVVDGLWRLQQEPDDVDDHLDEDEARAEEQLRLRGDEARPLRRPLRRVEDAGYPAKEKSSERTQGGHQKFFHLPPQGTTKHWAQGWEVFTYRFVASPSQQSRL